MMSPTTDSNPDTAKPTTAADRAYNNPSHLTARDGDWTTSNEAMQVLREQGVKAWQQWVADHQAGDG